MVQSLALRGAVAALAGAVATAGLLAPARAAEPVPIDKAGTIVGWGTAATASARTLPAALQGTPFKAVVASGGGFSVALTATGKVTVLGETGTPGFSLQEIPASVTSATVTSVATSGNNAGAVLSDGKAAVWGQTGDGPDPTDVPAGLTGVKSLALASYSAAALKTDGTVTAWGYNQFDQATVPDGLTGVTAIAAGLAHYYALKQDGTVVGWGRDSQDQLQLPAPLTVAGNVKAIAARSGGGLALLADGTLASWGFAAGDSNAVPDSLQGKTVVAISANGERNIALDSDGGLTVWGDSVPTEMSTIPAALASADIADISLGDGYALALVTKVMEVTKPAISGTVGLGQTLTATPATFSGGPTSISGQWLANGVEIAGATALTLTLTSAQSGKSITYASTATKTGESPVVSLSAATAILASDSTTTVSAAPGTYGTAGTATVTVSNAAGQPVSGTVTLSGAGGAQTAAVVGGKATFTLANALTPGAYALTASYSGGGALKASSGSGSYSVAKGKTKRPAFKVTKKATSKKKGKATVTVTAPRGLAKATGKVTITIKGKSKKTIKTTLSGGKKSISLPKLKKGTYKVTVSYAGDKNYGAQKSSTFKLKIKK